MTPTKIALTAITLLGHWPPKRRTGLVRRQQLLVRFSRETFPTFVAVYQGLTLICCIQLLFNFNEKPYLSAYLLPLFVGRQFISL